MILVNLPCFAMLLSRLGAQNLRNKLTRLLDGVHHRQIFRDRDGHSVCRAMAKVHQLKLSVGDTDESHFELLGACFGEALEQRFLMRSRDLVML